MLVSFSVTGVSWEQKLSNEGTATVGQTRLARDGCH